MDLQKIFRELLQRIGFSDNSIAKHWIDLEKAYSAKSRYYHTLSHLMEMIKYFQQYKNDLQFPDEVLYALFYHDFVYKSTRKDNELKSAELAIALLPENSILHKQIVFDLIVATKDHIADGTEDEKWLIDFDLSILAKDWEDYKIYYKQIRKEYSIYPDFLYNPGRKKALEHFLEKEFLYQTGIFRTLYEAKARQNIQHEISTL